MFEHKNLDGNKYRVLSTDKPWMKPEILEVREPKSGQDDSAAARTQYAVIGETLVERHLPPESVGDAWQFDSVASPWWEVVGHPPHGGIVADFNAYIGGQYERELDPANNVVAFAEQGEAVTFDGSAYKVKREGDAADLSGMPLKSLRQSYYA